MTYPHLAVRRALIAAAALVVVPLVAAPPAHAVVAAPVNLAPDSVGVSTHTPTLSWSKVSGATKYEVQADNDESFGSPAYSVTTTNNRAVPTKALPTGDVFWRVRALNASSVASTWSLASFSVTASAPPTPTSPVSGTSLAPAEPALLTWDGVAGATGYTVEVDETSEFTTPLVSQATQSTSFVVPVPLLDGEYFWRVKATRGTGTDTLYSDPASFVVTKLPAPVIVSPTSSVEFEIEDVVLDWQPVAGAAWYELEVATDVDFNTLVSSGTSKIYGTRYSPAVTYDNNQYYWRVRARDVATNPGPWATGEFNRVWESDEDGPGDDVPEAVYPLTGASPLTGDMYFEWTPVQHASHYELQLGSNASFSPGTFANCQIAGTTYTPGLYATDHVSGSTSQRVDEQCSVVPGNTYYWRVRALDRPFTSPGVESIYSEAQSFRFDDDDFSLLSPSAGATVAVPTLRWTPYRGADHYEVTVRDNTGSAAVNGKTTYSTSYTVTGKDLDPAKSPYTWEITAFSAKNIAESQTNVSSFNVAGSPASSGQPALTPLTGTAGSPATLRAPSLTWEPMAGAAWYRVFAGDHDPGRVGHSGTWYSTAATGNDILGEKLYYPAATDTWTWFLAPGQYDWYVQAYASDNTVLGSPGPVATFRISQLPAVTGQRIALQGSTHDADGGCAAAIGGSPDICTDVPATPVFEWDPVDGAGSYMVYVSEDASFTNLTEPLSKIPTTSNTRWTPTMSSDSETLADSQAGGAYYWFVRPCKTPKNCGPSPVSTVGTATNKFRKKSPAVVLQSPAIGATVTSTDVTFTWQDYRATNAGSAPWAQTGELGNQSAMAYRIQVDNDPNFSSPIENVVVDQATYTSPSRLYPDGELYWRVQAIDADNNGLTWSAPTSQTVLGRPFTKTTAAPAPVTPGNGAATTGTVPFRWAPMPSADKYELAVYKDGDTAASTGNKVFSVSTLKQPAYVWTKPLPAAPTPYVWRVRRIDSSQNPGPWSAWRSFTSTGTAPTLLAPAAGSLQPANGPLFSWSVVPRAASYTVEGRSPTSTSRPFSTVTTVANAWATTSGVPNGSWEWRVIAKDAGGAELGRSAWQGFKVDATAPTVTAKSPTSTAYRTANFVAKFSEPVKNVTSSTFQLIRASTGKPVAAIVTLSADKRTATLNPGSNLVVGAYYTAKLTSGITDLAGNKLVGVTWKVKAT